MYPMLKMSDSSSLRYVFRYLFETHRKYPQSDQFLCEKFVKWFYVVRVELYYTVRVMLELNYFPDMYHYGIKITQPINKIVPNLTHKSLYIKCIYLITRVILRAFLLALSLSLSV